MAIAKLQVLEEYAYDENDFVNFTDRLGAWALTWVPEIGLGIAQNAKELFGNMAIRILVDEWAKLEEKDNLAFSTAFDKAANGIEINVDDFKGIGTAEKNAYSQALYLLLVR